MPSEHYFMVTIFWTNSNKNNRECISGGSVRADNKKEAIRKMLRTVTQTVRDNMIGVSCRKSTGPYACTKDYIGSMWEWILDNV